jgi:RNA 3'-terminal phosphate cyclase
LDGKRSSKLSKATTKDPCGLGVTHLGDARIEVLKAVRTCVPAIHALLRSSPMDFDRLRGLARVNERTKQVAEREVHWGAERMTQSETIVTAWNNGAHHSSGAGYGVKLTTKDRDVYLRREWDGLKSTSPAARIRRK